MMGGEHVSQHPRSNGNSEQNLRDGEGTWEEAHECVEAVLAPDGGHDEQI